MARLVLQDRGEYIDEIGANFGDPDGKTIHITKTRWTRNRRRRDQRGDIFAQETLLVLDRQQAADLCNDIIQSLAT